jgi:hypothetical protein
MEGHQRGMVFNIIGRVNLRALVGRLLPPAIFLEYLGRQWENDRVFFLEYVFLHVHIFGDVAHTFPGRRIPSEWTPYRPEDFFMYSR